MLAPLMVMAVVFLAHYIGVWLLATRTKIPRTRVRAAKREREKAVR